MKRCLSQTRSLKPKFPQSCTTSRSAHHDDQIDTVRIPSQNIRFVERSNKYPTTESSELVALKDYFSTTINTPEAKITDDAQAVSKHQVIRIV